MEVKYMEVKNNYPKITKKVSKFLLFRKYTLSQVLM